jgi:hypothetical protein
MLVLAVPGPEILSDDTKSQGPHLLLLEALPPRLPCTQQVLYEWLLPPELAVYLSSMQGGILHPSEAPRD